MSYHYTSLSDIPPQGPTEPSRSAVFNEEEAIERCYERIKNDPKRYKIDPCPGIVREERLQAELPVGVGPTGPVVSITGPIQCAVAPCPQPGQPGDRRRVAKLVLPKTQSFLNKEYLGIQTKYLLIAGAGLVYVGVLLS